MDKTIITAGAALVGLAAGFLIASEIDYNLHDAYATGGYLWLVVGCATAGLGLKVKRERTEKKHMKIGAI